MKQCKPAPKQLQKGEKKELTDAEIDQMMQDRFAARKKLVETQETYYKKFKKDPEYPSGRSFIQRQRS